jgi:Tfp pilus assembly protein PilX
MNKPRLLHYRRAAARHPNERGVALVLAILTLFILSVLGLGLLFSTLTELRIAGSESTINRALYAADSGVQYGLVQGRTSDIGPGCTGLANYWCFLVPEMNTGTGSMKTMNVSISPMREVDYQAYEKSDLSKNATLKLYWITKHFESTAQDPVNLYASKTIAVDFTIGPLVQH